MKDQFALLVAGVGFVAVFLGAQLWLGSWVDSALTVLGYVAIIMLLRKHVPKGLDRLHQDRNPHNTHPNG
jgi:hypothetical protein